MALGGSVFGSVTRVVDRLLIALGQTRCSTGLASIDSRHEATLTISIAIAPSGHALTQAGVWPTDSRPWHMSHFPTTPRSGLYCGTPYEQFHVQVLAADAGVGAVPHDAGGGILRVGVNRASLQAGRLEAVVAPHRESTSATVIGNQPPSISRTRRQLIDAGLPFCSLQATTQHLQPMHLPMSTWKRYCSPGPGARSGMRPSCVGPVRANAGALPRLVSAKVTPSSFTRVSSGSDDIQTTPRRSLIATFVRAASDAACTRELVVERRERRSGYADATAGARGTLALTWNERGA